MSAPARTEARTRSVSTGAAAAGAPSGGTPPSRSRRIFIVLLALAMLLAIVAAVARGMYRDGPLEPDAPTAQGSKAAVQVLTDLGVEVEVDRHTADAAEALRAGDTVLVTRPSTLSAQQLAALDEARHAGDGRLVLVRPDYVTVSTLAPSIGVSGSLTKETTLEADPDCGDLSGGARSVRVPAKEDAIEGGTTLYRSDEGATSCFETEHGALVLAEDGVIVLGSPDLLTNEMLGEADNSALVLNTLGTGEELSWYVPSATDPMASSSPSLARHIPRWAGPLLLWLGLVAVLALVALSRRPGPVVIEPLPVTVRPQELVLGRARLLQRAGARDTAAASLRAAASTRLADRLGLRRETSLTGLVAALAEHTDLTDEELRALLGPSAVTTDQDLVRLAHDLDILEKEID